MPLLDHLLPTVAGNGMHLMYPYVSKFGISEISESSSDRPTPSRLRRSTEVRAIRPQRPLAVLDVPSCRYRLQWPPTCTPSGWTSRRDGEKARERFETGRLETLAVRK